jgi:hypothetical protein
VCVTVTCEHVSCDVRCDSTFLSERTNTSGETDAESWVGVGDTIVVLLMLEEKNTSARCGSAAASLLVSLALLWW